MADGFFDVPGEPTQDFVLYDAQRGNYLFRQNMTMTEAVEFTARLAKSFCPKLIWQKMSAEAAAALALRANNKISDQPSAARTYVIRDSKYR